MNLNDRAQQPEGGVYTGFVPDQKPYLKACPKLHALAKSSRKTFVSPAFGAPFTREEFTCRTKNSPPPQSPRHAHRSMHQRGNRHRPQDVVRCMEARSRHRRQRCAPGGARVCASPSSTVEEAGGTHPPPRHAPQAVPRPRSARRHAPPRLAPGNRQHRAPRVRIMKSTLSRPLTLQTPRRHPRVVPRPRRAPSCPAPAWPS